MIFRNEQYFFYESTDLEEPGITEKVQTAELRRTNVVAANIVELAVRVDMRHLAGTIEYQGGQGRSRRLRSVDQHRLASTGTAKEPRRMKHLSHYLQLPDLNL